MFSFLVAHEIMHDDYESRSIIECCQMKDWSKLEETIQTELASLATRNVFRFMTQTPDNVKFIRYKRVFIQK